MTANAKREAHRAPCGTASKKTAALPQGEVARTRLSCPTTHQARQGQDPPTSCACPSHAKTRLRALRCPLLPDPREPGPQVAGFSFLGSGGATQRSNTPPKWQAVVWLPPDWSAQFPPDIQRRRRPECLRLPAGSRLAGSTTNEVRGKITMLVFNRWARQFEHLDLSSEGT